MFGFLYGVFDVQVCTHEFIDYNRQYNSTQHTQTQRAVVADIG